MKNLKHLLFLSILCSLVFFSSFKSTLSTNTNEKISTDPVVEFKKYLKDHFESYKTDPIEELALLAGGWVMQKYSLEGEYSFDVQTTNSLVKPIIGNCDFTLKRSMTAFHMNKESAMNDKKYRKLEPRDYIKHRHTYYFQDEKWIVDTREFKLELGSEVYWLDCNEIIEDKGDGRTTNLHRCHEN